MSRDKDQTVDEIRRMQQRMDRLFNDMMPTLRWLTESRWKTWRPPTDVYETDEAVVVKVEIAGMSEEDFAVSVSNRSLSITGVRRDPECKVAYQQLEIPYGHFSTEVFLPRAVSLDEVSAKYDNGFLTVVLPKSDRYRVQLREKVDQDEEE